MNNRGRSSFGGKNIQTQTQTSRASSTTSTIDTPSEASTSPSIDMSPNGHPAVNGVAADLESTTLNGALQKRMPSKRKQSSPMMPPFMVSAPGKVIVFGEHAVVHCKVRTLSMFIGIKLIGFNYRQLLQLRFLYAHISSLPRSPNRNEPSPSDSQILNSTIRGILTSYRGVPSPTPLKRSIITTSLPNSTTI